MAITQKFNLPSVLGDEAKRYRELFEKGNNRTAVGSVSFTSATSGTTYNSTSGEAGIFAQLQTALEDYNVDAAWSDEIYGLVGVVPWQAWMYTNFKGQLTPAEISDIETNPTLMAIINSYFASKTEAEEGINSSKTMTPLRVKESVAYNEKKPITGMVTTSGTGTHNFTLPVNGSAVLVGTISPNGMESQPHKLVLQGQSNIEGGGGSTDAQIRYSLSGTTLTIINGSAYTGTRNYTYVIFY